jgi:hypothetical protein
MAISSLTQLTQEQYKALSLSAFRANPIKTSSGSPDPDAQITLGGWVGDTVIAFYINDNAGTQVSLGIDKAEPNTIDINVLASSSRDPIVSYWTVNMGDNARNTDWSISFDVAAGGTKTGIWVFKKGKITIDED